MKSIAVLAALFLFPSLLSAHDDVVVKEMVLSTCYKDAPFDKSLIADFFQELPTQSIYRTEYKHSYHVVTKKLIVAISNHQQVYEREVEATANATEYFEISRRSSTPSRTSEILQSIRDRLTQDVERYLKGRKLFACEQN